MLVVGVDLLLQYQNDLRFSNPSYFGAERVLNSTNTSLLAR